MIDPDETLTIQFNMDSPFVRATFGWKDACESYGLTGDEFSAVLMCFMEGGKPLRMRKMPPFIQAGLLLLTARGWATVGKGKAALLDVPEIGEIYKAGESAARFGNEQGRA